MHLNASSDYGFTDPIHFRIQFLSQKSHLVPFDISLRLSLRLSVSALHSAPTQT